jgi:hypothetical protein
MSPVILQTRSFINPTKHISFLSKQTPNCTDEALICPWEACLALGNPYFYHYIIWRFLHPLFGGPERIFISSGVVFVSHLYQSILNTIVANLLDYQDAWRICDEASPTSYMECPIVVSSSPANFQFNDITDAKKFFKTANCKVYLPPWTAEEIWEAATRFMRSPTLMKHNCLKGS